MSKVFQVAILFFCMNLCVVPIYGQLQYGKIADSIIKTNYSCIGNNVKGVKNSALIHHMQSAFKKVIVQNDDLVKYGSATNISIDKEKKLSGNVFFKAGQAMFINVGLSGNTTDNVLNFFSSKNLQNGITLNIGFDVLSEKCHPFFKNKLFFDNNCDSINLIRKLYLVRKLDTLNKIYDKIGNRKDTLEKDSGILKSHLIGKSSQQLFEDDKRIKDQVVVLTKIIKKVKDSIAEYEVEIERMKVKKPCGSASTKCDTNITENQISLKRLNDFLKQNESNVQDSMRKLTDSILVQLIRIEDSLAHYRKYIGDGSNKFISKVMDDEILGYDKSIVSNVISGYKMIWWRINTSLSSQDFNLFDTSIIKRSDSSLYRRENYLNWGADISFNTIWDTKNGLKFLYFSGGFIVRKGLQDLTYKDSFIADEDLIVRINNNEGYNLQKLDSTYNKSYGIAKFELGGFAFWGVKRQFGFEANISVHIPFGLPSHIHNYAILNARIGPLFTFGESNKILAGGTTIGLFAKINNWAPNDKGKNFRESIAFGVRLGLTFGSLKALK